MLVLVLIYAQVTIYICILTNSTTRCSFDSQYHRTVDDPVQHSCKPCPLGKYQNSRAQRACISLPSAHDRGGYASTAAPPSAKAVGPSAHASAGTTAGTTHDGRQHGGRHSSGALTCGVGRYVHVAVVRGVRMRACLDCPRGKYQRFVGADSCKLCRSGRFNRVPSAATCHGSFCPVGYFGRIGAISKRWAFCQRCPGGKYQPGMGEDSCWVRPAGWKGDKKGPTPLPLYPTITAAPSALPTFSAAPTQKPTQQKPSTSPTDHPTLLMVSRLQVQ
jgi:hypothetical protein